MSDGDTGEELKCVICGSVEWYECGHLVACYDHTYCEVDGGALEYRVRGDGPPLVLVHGSVFADPWEPMLRHADLLASH